MSDREAFDPADTFDAMADKFRKQIADMALAALDSPEFRKLPGHRQLECLMAGVMTGLIGACMAQIEPAGREAVISAFEDYLPLARENAEAILDGNGTQVQ